MAFQTNVLRDGEWVTETVNLHAVLKSQQTAPRNSTRKDPLAPPQCGLLTRTVVGSALTNLILPVRLRSPFNNDIAFVGDDFVQICELRKDGRLKNIVRKNDFGCRIRNACVVGSFLVPELKDETSGELSSQPTVKAEDDHAHPFGFASSGRPSSSPRLPPQLLMVVLETGDSVFMFVRSGPDGRPESVSSRFGGPRHSNGYPGFHLAIDPSSRYMALAGPADYFVVYELASHSQLSEAYSRNEPLQPVKSFRLRSVRGVIHKIAFLYPRPGDHHHIILLLVIIRNGKSRTVIYEWELSDDLKTVFAEERQGHRMPVEHQMPLLLVPLTIQSAFIAISPDRIAICTECLHGPPMFHDFEITRHPPTASHRGRHQPLWTAWCRPFRLQTYSSSRDCIYVAREDGVVLFMEFDQDCDLGSNTVIGPFPCNVSSAVACLFDHSTDVLVLGSDSGPGGYWKIPPRQAVELLGTLPNWSPVVDFTTTGDPSGGHQKAQQEKVIAPWQQSKLQNPERVFATCEGGGKGSITEYRYGLKANIGLDLEFGVGMKQAWLLPSPDPSAFGGYLLLLSMPDCTAALFLPGDFSSASAPASGAIPYDLSSTTLVLSSTTQLTVQVTKQNLVLVAHGQSAQFPCQTLPRLLNASLSDACVLDDFVAISAHMDARFRIHVLKVDQHNLTVVHAQTIDVDGEITCLSLGPGYSVLAGIRKNAQTYLAYGSLQQAVNGLEMINLTEYLGGKEEHLGLGSPASVEGIESIIPVRDTILLGTRSGEVIAVKDYDGSVSVYCEKFGMTTANLCCSYRAGETDPRVLVSCDNILSSVVVNDDSSRRGEATRLRSKYRVWPVDASKPESIPPPVDYASVVDMPSEDGITPVLMISGARLLLAEMHEEPGPVHRSIPVEGCPSRVLYCRFTQCLVVAVNRLSGPSLMFIDPDTGENIGRPTDKNGEPQACISGLGKEGDRVMGLTEWNYKRDGHVWNFILVATRSGRLIVVTTQKAGTREDGRPAIRYWTRFRKEVGGPIYSVVGYDQGLIYCFGRTIQWEVLDAQQRRLKPLKSLPLGSPATSLRISNGKLLALTNTESLVVLDHLETANLGENNKPRLRHVDPWRRNGVDFIEAVGPPLDDHPTTGGGGSGGGESIMLVADRECGVTGLWVPWQTPERECEVVFEAELPSSVRRFQRGRTRPQGGQAGVGDRTRYGRLPAMADDVEILGVALSGAMYHFTLLSVEAWRLLRFIQNLALASDEVCPFQGLLRMRDRYHATATTARAEEDPEPRLEPGLEMHVDGDILRRCLEKKALERLVVREGHMSRFMKLLDDLDGGQHTAGWADEGNWERYVRLMYDILEYYLLPVI